MAGVLEQLLVLCNQLVVIGYDNPEVLIAGMMIVFAIAITIVACCLGILVSIPVLIITSIVKFFVWLYRLWHPKPVPVETAKPQKKSSKKTSKKKQEENYMPRPRQNASHSATPKHRSAPVSDLPPVYPDWMNQKSGRLL